MDPPVKQEPVEVLETRVKEEVRDDEERAEEEEQVADAAAVATTTATADGSGDGDEKADRQDDGQANNENASQEPHALSGETNEQADGEETNQRVKEEPGGDAEEQDNNNDDDDEDDDEEDEDEEEDDIKVTIEDYPTENKAAIQKQPQQAKQAAPAILEANQAIVDINTLDDKPWRKPGADINDYFNYGFDEPTWRLYCDQQKHMKNTVNEIVDTQAETYRIPVVGHNDMMHKHDNHHSYQMPVMQPIIQPVVIPPSRDMHMRDLSPIVEQQSHGRSRHGDRQHQRVSPQMHQQPPSSSGGGGGGGSRSGRDHRDLSRDVSRDVSSHRHSRSPHTTRERERKHSSGRSRKEDSKSRERRRSRSKETKKRRSRSRERDDDRRSKRHKSSRRA